MLKGKMEKECAYVRLSISPYILFVYISIFTSCFFLLFGLLQLISRAVTGMHCFNLSPFLTHATHHFSLGNILRTFHSFPPFLTLRPSLSRCFHSFHLFHCLWCAILWSSANSADGSELKLPFLTHAGIHGGLLNWDLAYSNSVVVRTLK